MPKLRKSNATFWVIFKQCGIVIKNSGLLCDSTVVPNIFRCLEKCFISSTEIEWHANCFVNSEWKWRSPILLKHPFRQFLRKYHFNLAKKLDGENSILYCYDFHRNWISRLGNFMLQIRRFCKLKPLVMVCDMPAMVAPPISTKTIMQRHLSANHWTTINRSQKLVWTAGQKRVAYIENSDFLGLFYWFVKDLNLM